jgi:hypothetical protein
VRGKGCVCGLTGGCTRVLAAVSVAFAHLWASRVSLVVHSNCSAGYFGSTLGLAQATCTAACPAGQFSTGGAAMGCSPCPVGRFGADAALASPLCSGECVARAGRWCGDAATAADGEACPVGQFAPSSGTTKCTPCPAGQFAPATGMASCLPCEAGWYAGGPGWRECSRCPSGRFGNSSGSSAGTCFSGCLHCACRAAVLRFGAQASDVPW